MFRRSRFSVRPNVGAAGRAAATSQDASETPKDVGDGGPATAVTDNKSAASQAEKPAASGDGNDQNGDGANSSAAVQRRKRFSIKPKVAPGRPSTGPRTTKSPNKAVSATPVEVPGPDLDQQTVSKPSQSEIQCPVPEVQPELIPSESSGPSAAALAEDSPEQTDPPADSCKKLEATPGSPVKEVSPKLPEKVLFSIPSREAIELSEKAKTLVASKDRFSLSPSALSLSRLLNDPSDLQRLAKARKLRELLRQESCKERKKIKRARIPPKEFTLDPSKMTMRDLIHYLPGSNPMKSSLEDPALENETVVPPSPGREESPEEVQESADPPAVTDPTEEEDPEAGEEDDALMVPRVKVAEDGTLIIDEESLTVEVQRTKGPNPAQERDPIFERGSTTTYSSFRKGTFAKPWSSEETDMFFLAISMVGTDFSMICQLFPHRPRSEIKNKFKKEERANSWRVDKAFRERRKLDIEYFSKLLEKILEVQKNRKKLKSLSEKNSQKKNKRKGKGKKATKKRGGEEEEEADEEEGSDPPDLEKEGEKENEDLCNEGGTPDSKPKKKRKRKEKASKEEPTDKKNKTGEKSNEQDEVCTLEEAEGALPEDCEKTDKSEKSENAAKESAIKPAKLSRGRAPKPLLPLGRKWGKKPPPASTKAKDTAPDKGDETVGDEASDEQVNKDASPVKPGIKRKPPNDDVSSEEDDVTVQPQRPTRYGRMPKPIKPLNYRAKEATPDSTPTSPAGSTASAAKPRPKSKAKRGQSSKSESASKKSKLVTLRASQTDYSDEESENQWEDGELEEEEESACSSSKDSKAPAFVPASLRSPQPVMCEVEESMEELDMLANIPDVLGISQDALCPDASCEMAQNETGTSETCEHQLDLLVDVIDFLSAEVCQDESYNEAAQTLLTIGNLTHLSQSAQNQTVLQDHITGMGTVGGDETGRHPDVTIASNPAEQEENSATPLPSTFTEGVADASEPVAPVELQSNTTDMPVHDQKTSSDMDSVEVPQMQSSPEKQQASQTRTGRLSKVKPKPNLSRASRAAQSRSQTETSSTEESPMEASDPPQATETATGESSKTANSSQRLLKDDISCVEVKLKEEPSVSQEKPDSQGVTDAVELQISTGDNSDIPPIETSDLQTGSDLDLTPRLESTPDRSKRNSPQTRTRRISRVKPKPNLSQASRTDQLRSRTEESHRAAPDFSQPTETAAEEMPERADGSQKGDISCIDLIEEASGSQEMSIDQIKSGADHPAPCLTPVEDLHAGLKEGNEDESTSQARRSRFQGVQPKPNLASTSRTKPKTTEKDSDPTCSTTPPGNPSQYKTSSTASVSVPSMELDLTQNSTEELSSADDQKTDGRSVLDSGSEGSEQKAIQRRRRLPKVKPNFGGSVRTTRMMVENPAVERESTGEAGKVSQSDITIKPTETNTQPTDDQTAASVRSSEGDSRQSQIKAIRPPDSQGSTEQPPASEAQSQHVTQPCAETTESNQSTDENDSKSTQSSTKAPVTRRGRLIKPKPNLRRSSQPPQLQQVQNTKQAVAGSGVPSGSVDASGSHKPVSEPRPDFQEPAEGAIEQHINQASPHEAECSIGSLTQVIEVLNELDPASNVAGSSLGCLTDNSAKPQVASTSSTGEIQDHSSLSIFADMLPEQVPSDLDGPFFILSLTEIPVCSSGEVSGSLPHLTVTEPSIQQPSIPALAAAGDVVLSNVPVPMEESFVAGLIRPEAAAQIGSIMEGPVDPHESTMVQPSKIPETEEISDEAENSPAKLRQRATRRPAAKPQDEPTTQRKTRASKTPAAKKSAPPTQDSELPGPSVELQVFDEFAEPQRGRADTQREAQTGGKHPEGPPSTRGASRQNRKAKGFASFASETNNSNAPPGKAASSSRTVRTQAGAAGKRSAPAPTASTSKGIVAAPGRTPSKPSSTTPVEVDVEETSEFQLCSTPNTSLCTAEVSASQQSDSIDCVEATNVSQYFLSDIFTDVEEG